jgi:hypothetical protein
MEWYSCPGVGPGSEAVHLSGWRVATLPARGPQSTRLPPDQQAFPGLGRRRAWSGSGPTAGLTYSGDRAMRHFRGLRQPFPITSRHPVPAAAGRRRQCRPSRPCAASGRNTSWRVAPRLSPARTGPGHSGDRQGCIAGNIYRRNPDIRSRLSAFTGRTHPPRPRANVTHIGPGQARNARPRGNRSRPGRVDDLDSAR